MSDVKKASPGRLVFSIEEAAEALCISRDTFERYVIAELRLVRVGRRLLVPVRELERWVEQHAGTPLIADLARIANGRSADGAR